MDFLPAEVLAASLIFEDTFNVVPFRILKYLHYMGYVEVTLALKCMLHMGQVCCQHAIEKNSFVWVELLGDWGGLQARTYMENGI